MIKKAICPNCGAEGTVGRYCEFCGTKIPAPIVNQTANSKPKEHRPRIVRFSITKDDAIELFFNYLYKKGVSFENINLTVVNIKTYSIPLLHIMFITNIIGQAKMKMEHLTMVL